MSFVLGASYFTDTIFYCDLFAVQVVTENPLLIESFYSSETMLH